MFASCGEDESMSTTQVCNPLLPNITVIRWHYFGYCSRVYYSNVTLLIFTDHTEQPKSFIHNNGLD